MSFGNGGGDGDRDAGDEVVQGGEPPCMLELVCEECGRLDDGPRPVNCGGCGTPLGRG
ncbi:hypothetical protein SSPS47_14435 [Streptomyces sp. S4.7]|uniref:hypothetical protein n=1 Tax=Streptomyces sp. S4.7 TaxID=2705439 RepID=UPI00139804AF|nr:hypothetical protein [Streptomyces sp. S4.7]QHY96312.1 hypothetical protein SSPS47_14435 [Streptomyces sp. S4.7]